MPQFLAGLGFAEACEIKPGDKVMHGCQVQVVQRVSHKGKDWPYFDLPNASAEWTSWQQCGKVVNDAPAYHE